MSSDRRRPRALALALGAVLILGASLFPWVQSAREQESSSNRPGVEQELAATEADPTSTDALLRSEEQRPEHRVLIGDDPDDQSADVEPAAGQFVLRVQVVDPSEHPIPEAQVRVLFRFAGEHLRGATDSQGCAEFHVDQVAQLRGVVASAAGYAEDFTGAGDDLGQEGNATLTITLRRATCIVVDVLSTDGTPLAYHPIDLDFVSAPDGANHTVWSGARRARTDQYGLAKVDDLPPGEWSVRAWFWRRWDRTARTHVTARSGESKRVTIEVAPRDLSRSLSGTVHLPSDAKVSKKRKISNYVMCLGTGIDMRKAHIYDAGDFYYEWGSGDLEARVKSLEDGTLSNPFIVERGKPGQEWWPVWPGE